MYNKKSILYTYHEKIWYVIEEEKEQNERRRKRTQKRKVIIKYNTPLCNNNILL